MSFRPSARERSRIIMGAVFDVRVLAPIDEMYWSVVQNYLQGRGDCESSKLAFADIADLSNLQVAEQIVRVFRLKKVDVRILAASLQEKFAEREERELCLRSGAADLLGSLALMAKTLVVYGSEARALRLRRRLGWPRTPNQTVTCVGSDAFTLMEPDEHLYDAAAKSIKVPLSRCAVFTVSSAGARAAKAAGASRVICLPSGEPQIDSSCVDTVLSALDEFRIEMILP